ncbi:hypothetical protein, partial [Pseudidiomarina donghaiensis]
PYSYIMNNPLAGTDPSGYIAKCMLSIHCDTDESINGVRIISRPQDYAQLSSNGNEQQAPVTNNQKEASEIGSQNDSTSVENDSSSGDSRYLTASTDDAQFHWDGKHTDGPKTTKTTTEYETDVEFEGTLETLRATKYELQTTPSANLPDFTKTGGIPVGPGIDVAIDWNNYDVTFQVYSLYEVTTTQTSWSRETVAISSITGQKIRYHSKVSPPPKVVRTSLGRYWTIKGKTGQKVGTMKFPLPVPIPTR